MVTLPDGIDHLFKGESEYQGFQYKPMNFKYKQTRNTYLYIMNRLVCIGLSIHINPNRENH